ncbi:uncharacterized protein LOC118186735 [Stegodyphus dumicola]|uniref:uncharacterized protein LOC118186735 n=1 Tax=Stegodyphus dumicola TaxID=202533 RepID=UPI0015AF7D9D|nr:uncharacterized protein LOC118186735 [Stegodyphus dumicola]XP_035212761.1 uncharacterized protein LOC118186735 [Stegodyphus dumicola]XP_035212762.1 uncharacterized protein LOC118186735 [Stegodyphus dumicola]XP_035212763.1 uncharacterized protein LOC118186735 [Stegodyphus dumicola]
MDLEENYRDLKNDIIRLFGSHTDLEAVKLYFKKGINSNRALSRVQSLQDVIDLLEERDLLNSKNVNVLLQLAEFMKNSDAEERVRLYNKLVLDDPDPPCICGFRYYYTPDINEEDLENHNDLNSSTDANNNIENKRLEQAMENIAQRIGKKWRILAAELGLKECQIDLIRRDSRDIVHQARRAFQIWVQTHGHVTMQMLDKALQERLCRKEGIGLHLKDSIIGITC